MNPLYLIDTNLCIDVSRRQNARLSLRLAGHSFGTVAMSVVTLGELRVGAERSARRLDGHRIIEDLLELIPAVALPEAAAGHYGEIRAHLARIGQIIGNNDLWIGAHARALGATIATSNVREFVRIPGLRVEDWAAPDAG